MRLPLSPLGLGTLLIMLVAAVLAAGLTVVSARHANERMLRHDAATAGEQARGVLASILTAQDFAAPLAGERLQAVQRATRERILVGPTVGLTVWSPAGTVVYSDGPLLIGGRAQPDQAIASALGGAIAIDVAGEGPSATGSGTLRPAHLVSIVGPLQLGDRTEAVFETLWDSSQLEAELAALDRFRALGALTGLGLFYVAIVLLGRWVGGRMESQRGENRDLARSLESSQEELSQAMEEAQRARGQFDLLARAVESADETIIVYDLDGRIRYANPAVRQVHGYEPEELIGQNIRIFQPPGRKPLADEIIAQASHGVWRGEVNVLRKDAVEIPVHLSASAVRDEEGAPRRMVAVGRDLSEQRRRTAELVEARSEAAAFRQAEAMKSELITMVSHELRTPLTALQGFSELLLTRGHTADEARLWTETIHSESVRLARLLDDLLNVSRLEAGAIEPTFEAVAVGDVARDVSRALALQSPVHTLTVHSDPENLRAMADPILLAQVLENLLSNAIKYSPAGGEVRVAIRRDVQMAIVSITDQGVGISADQLPRLFTRFYRLGGADSSGVRGAGLGLYIAQQLVALQGGVIWASSEPGRGSTFTFTLPVAVDDPTRAWVGREEDHAGGRRSGHPSARQRDPPER